MTTYNRKTVFYFTSPTAFKEAKDFMIGMKGFNWSYGYNRIALGRKVAYIECSPKNAAKHCIDLYLDGLYALTCSHFSYPKKLKS